MQKRRLLFPFHALKYVALGLIGVAVLATGLTLWALRGDAIKAAERDADNVASILAEQISRSVHAVDSILNEFSNRAAAAAIISPGQFRQGFGTQPLFEVMRERLAQLPQADIITVVDCTGRTLNSTMRELTAIMDFSDRDYFKYLSTHDSAEMYVSVPVAGKVTGAWKIFFSKRINGGFGDFVGVVSIGVEIQFFQQSYDSIRALPSQSFVLLRSDGTVLVRYPDPKVHAGEWMPPGSLWYDVVAHGGGFYRSPGYFDADARLIAVHSLFDYPLVVNVGTLESAALATWKRRATLIGFGTLLATLCSVLLLRALTTQFRRLSESEACLVRSSRQIESINLHLDAALNNMLQGVCMFDKAQRLIVFNERFVEMYGLPKEAIMPGRTLVEVLDARAAAGTFSGNSKQFAAELNKLIAEGKQDRFTIELADGRVIAISNQPLSDGGWVTTHEDVTERQRSEARIAHMAHNDLLTGIANRPQFLEQIDKARGRLRTSGQPFTVLMLDLDHFKDVNDSLGHAAGDALLKQTARRLEAALRSTDVLARLGGDEFAIIQTPPRDFKTIDEALPVLRENAIALANRIIEVIGRPFDIDGQNVVVGTSIGIAMAPVDGTEPDELMKKADLALYKTKSDGRNGYTFFDRTLAEVADERHQLEVDLRAGLSRDEFELHYQPQIDVVTGQICGMEALVRWHHPDQGLIPPDRFIPLAEDTGLITTLGEWILQAACAEASKWPPHVKVAINISPVQFRKTNLLDVILCALVDADLPPERLEIEITERVLLEDDADHLSTLHQLKNLGISIALDDFGTGQSSLGYLKMFPFDKVKIDRSYTQDLLERPDCAAITCAVINLGRALDIVTVVEGVETQAQFEAVRAVGATQVQGYLFGRPVPAAQIVFDAVDGGAAVERALALA